DLTTCLHAPLDKDPLAPRGSGGSRQGGPSAPSPGGLLWRPQSPHRVVMTTTVGITKGEPGLFPTRLDLSSSHPRTVRSPQRSTRLNSSHVKISYAVLCLQKKK